MSYLSEQDLEQLRKSLFDQELEKSLEGELEQLAAEVNLSRERLVAEAEAQAEEIQGSTATAWQKLEEAIETRDRLERARGSVGHLLKVAAERPAPWLGMILALVPVVLVLAPAIPLPRLGLPLGLGPPALIAAAFYLATKLAATMGYPELRIAADSRVAREQSYREKLRQAGIQPWLREQINTERGLSFNTALAFRSSSGLAEVDDPDHEIPTLSRENLVKTMREGMPGGAIGLSGPRGVGKSTLMRSACGRGLYKEDELEILGVVVDAPVAYDARDFVLHLFSRVCSEVLGREEVEALRGWNRSFGAPSRRRSLESVFLLAIGSLMALAGALLLLHVDVHVSGRVGWALVLLAAGYACVGVAVLREWNRRIRDRHDLHVASTGGDARDSAAARLTQIWFQQSFSTGWSGAFKTPIGLEAGINGSTELAEKQMSFPDIVTLLKDFLEDFASDQRQVRIGIDELDKMDDETARRFLNEIKVVFRVPNCFFLISISEDAMSFFESRGLPFRDVFDSSFDDVMQVPQLELKGSRALLERRIVGLPLPFACFLHCRSGGLPRDLIREARDLVELKPKTSLKVAVAKQMEEDLCLKANAAKVASRQFKSEAHITTLVVWLDELHAASCDADALLALCRNFRRRFLAKIRALPDEDDLREERRALQALGTQLLAFVYLAATMSQFFAKFEDKAFVVKAADIGEALAKEGVVSLVDRLADVSQSFSADLSTVWTTLSGFREELDLGSVDFPLSPRGNGGWRRFGASANGGGQSQAARLQRRVAQPAR